MTSRLQGYGDAGAVTRRSADLASPAQEPGGLLARLGRRPRTLNCVIAVVGCDGTGKTTLVRDIVATLGRARPTQRRYMGLISGETGDKIKQLPGIGVALERRLAAKVRRAQDMERKLPGTFTAIVMYGFSIWRLFQMRRLIRLSESGVLVIAERYPQAEIPGFHYDGPGLSVDRTSNPLVRRLAAAEQRLYERMAHWRPRLVIRLTIDPETAFARKSDHPLSELRAKIRDMPRIDYDGARIVEIDARQPYDQVLDATIGVVRAEVGQPATVRRSGA